MADGIRFTSIINYRNNVGYYDRYNYKLQYK